MVTRVSGAFGWLFSILEFDASNDLGDLVQAIQALPLLAGRLAQFEDYGERGHGRVLECRLLAISRHS